MDNNLILEKVLLNAYAWKDQEEKFDIFANYK